MSNLNEHNESVKSRGYRMGKRAELQAQTRQRIVEAAVELHSSIGPARTTIAQIAERAGVRRNTYYAHFPQERDLLLACSGLALERDPVPDAASLQAVPAGPERLRAGLEQIYAWYERNDQQFTSVMRDAEWHALTGEIVALRFGPPMRLMAEVLGHSFDDRSKALLAVALSFGCWKTLSADWRSSSAAKLMADAISALWVTEEATEST